MDTKKRKSLGLLNLLQIFRGSQMSSEMIDLNNFWVQGEQFGFLSDLLLPPHFWRRG